MKAAYKIVFTPWGRYRGFFVAGADGTSLRFRRTRPPRTRLAL
jgi:hypothetical protein